MPIITKAMDQSLHSHVMYICLTAALDSDL